MKKQQQQRELLNRFEEHLRARVDYTVSIIDCGSKFNLTLFINILNPLCNPYFVVYDENPINPELMPGGPRHVPDGFREAKRLI